MPFAHIAMAVEGCGWTHPDYFALMVANVVSMFVVSDPSWIEFGRIPVRLESLSYDLGDGR